MLRSRPREEISSSARLTAEASHSPFSSMIARDASLAGYLNAAWNNSDARFAALFGYLAGINSASQFNATLTALMIAWLWARRRSRARGPFC